MVSMKMIAEYCGVSTATVSKSLNDHKDISEETKKRVRDAAKELGYFPNAAARVLKTNRSNNIGVLFTDAAGKGLLHEYFSGVLSSFREYAEAEGFDITFINNSYPYKEMTYLEHCKYRNFDGVVIVCAEYSEPEVQELMNSNLPVVTVDYIHQSCPSVCSNNICGMEDLVRYIYQRGHRKIAFIHGESFSYVTKERVGVFYRTVENLGLNIPDEYIRESSYLNAKEAAVVTSELLTLKDPPTCIIYPDDTACIGGRNVITENGMRIPDDISIAGYDGTEAAQLLHPRLTTIRQKTEVIGKEAARILVESIRNPKMTFYERVVIDGTLLHGQSVGYFEEESR